MFAAILLCLPTALAETAAALIFSDVDDTLKSGGGGTWSNGIAGVEPAYHHSAGGQLYPGMPTLLFEMSKHLNGNPANQNVPKVNFLTARPCGTQSDLQSQIIAASGHGDWGSNRPYTGDDSGSCCGVSGCLFTRPSWYTLNGNALDNFATREQKFRNYGDTKYEGIRGLSNEEGFDDNPQTRVYFFGDNGQGDVHAANRLNSEGMRRAGVFRMAFIHDIEVDSRANNIHSYEWFEPEDTSNIIMYNNVIDLMNNSVFQREIGLSSAAMGRVRAAFQSDFAGKGGNTAESSNQYRLDAATYARCRSGSCTSTARAKFTAAREQSAVAERMASLAA